MRQSTRSRRLRRPGLLAALGMLLGLGLTLAGCYYVVPAPPPGAVLVPGQWVWNGAAWVWRPPYWASPSPAPPGPPPPGATLPPPPPKS